MGSKYTTISSSGFDSSPPADDGSQVAANLITWSGIKSKLASPLKTEIDAINSALVTAFDYSVRQITASDSTVASDHMKCVEIAPTVTTAVTVSLGDAATMTNNYRVFVKNSSARNQTVSRVTGGDTIDGTAGSITLPPGAGAIYQTTTGASGYLTAAWFGPFSDANPVVAGGTDGTKKIRIEADGLTTATTRVWTAADIDVAIGKQPTRQVFTSGSGTYTTPTGATRINVRLVGGGGGGAAANTNGGTAGNNTTFSTLTGSGGGAGAASAAGGTGGAAAGGDFNIPGGAGGPGATALGTTQPGGGPGGNTAFGGGGRGGITGADGGAGATNSGAGGGGGGQSASTCGGGGGGGGYVEKLITAPSATYSYGVGAAANGGAAGGQAGGAGAAGIIVVDEYYN